MITLTNRFRFLPEGQTRPGVVFSPAQREPGVPHSLRDRRTLPVPVNFREGKAGCQLELVVPGFTKEDFQIQVDGNLLTITATERQQNDPEQGRYLRREYQATAFKRQFSLDERLNGNGVQAAYVNGILTLNLPFREPVKEQTTRIDVN